MCVNSISCFADCSIAIAIYGDYQNTEKPHCGIFSVGIFPLVLVTDFISLYI